MASYKLPREQVLRLVIKNENNKPNDLYYDTLKDISSKITAYRKENNITNKQLANMSGITTSVMSRVESGYQNISLLTICKVLNILGMKLKIINKEDDIIEELADSETDIYEDLINDINKETEEKDNEEI